MRCRNCVRLALLSILLGSATTGGEQTPPVPASNRPPVGSLDQIDTKGRWRVGLLTTIDPQPRCRSWLPSTESISPPWRRMRPGGTSRRPIQSLWVAAGLSSHPRDHAGRQAAAYDPGVGD
jgi:hypothetical protein